MQLTVQLPPIQLRPPLASAFWITGRLTGSRMMTASSFMRSVEARVDPVAVPAGAQFGETPRWCSHRPGGDDDVAALERLDVVGVLAASSRSSPSQAPPPPALLVEEHRLDGRSRPRPHAVHQHGADHAAPADQSRGVVHRRRPFKRNSGFVPDEPWVAFAGDGRTTNRSWSVS